MPAVRPAASAGSSTWKASACRRRSPTTCAPRLAQWLDELKTPQTLRDYASVDEVAERLRKTNPRLSADKAALAGAALGRAGATTGAGTSSATRRTSASTRCCRAPRTRVETWRRITAPLLWVRGRPHRHVAAGGAGASRASSSTQRLAVVPQVQRVLLSDAGHMLHHDQPEALALALQRFLDAG